MFRTRSDKIFDILNTVLVVFILLLILYPLYFTVIASCSDPYEVVSGNVTFWFSGFSVESYKQVLSNKDIWIGYKNSIINTLFGTLFSVLLTIPAAYALSKKKLWSRSLLITYFMVTMFFSGGLLPTYLVVRDIGLLNKPYTMIVLGAFSVYNLIIAKNYFQNSIPTSIFEAAQLDGCSHFGEFIYIALPLSKPIIAVIALFYAVAHWNEFYNALIYISNQDYYPLQLVLRNTLIESQSALSAITVEGIQAEEMAFILKRAYMAEAMKYSVIIIVSLPMWIIYPFIQKYFVKNLMLGSIKE